MHWAAYKGELAIVQLLHHLGLPVRFILPYVCFAFRLGGWVVTMCVVWK